MCELVGPRADDMVAGLALAIRKLQAAGARVIVVEAPPREGPGPALEGKLRLMAEEVVE